MKRQLRLNDVYVKLSKLHGYGVFAGRRIRKGEIIEDCYIILTKGGDDVLEDYYFDARGKYALLTGYGSIYNHSEDPNADYDIDKKRKLAIIKADRIIEKGEEIFVSYGDKWFSSRDKKAMSLDDVKPKKKRKTTKKTVKKTAPKKAKKRPKKKVRK